MKMRSNGTANVSASSSKIYTNKTILTTDWVSDAFYNDYPYKAVVTCTNIAPEDFVEVDLGEVSSVLSPFVVTDENCVYFYASEIPSEDLVINSIISTSASYGEFGFVVTAPDDNAEGVTVTISKA